jgi:hypothetical protein
VLCIYRDRPDRSPYVNVVVGHDQRRGSVGPGVRAGAYVGNFQGEDTYDWETGEWSAPVNFLVSKIVKIGGQPVSIVGGVRYWMDSPDIGPHGFGGRLGMTFLFPAR